MHAQEILASRFVELCLGIVMSEIIILLHTHTHTYFLRTSLTDFFFCYRNNMLWLDAPTSLFSLSQTSSDIRFRDRNPALSCADIADFWLSKEYLVRLIISQLEQTVMQWDATYHFSWLIARLFTHQSVYSYLSNVVEIISPVEFAKGTSYGKIMTSAWDGSQ